MVKIGYDAKRLFNNFTGLGNYSRTLLQDLSTHYPENEYLLFTPKIVKNNRTAPFFDTSKFSIKTATGNKAYWRTFGVKKDLIENQVQIFHGLSHEIPVGIQKTKIKSVVTIHDLIFKHYPKQFPFLIVKFTIVNFDTAAKMQTGSLQSAKAQKKISSTFTTSLPKK